MEEWQREPPATQQGDYDWPQIMRELHRKPGRWLLIRRQAARSIQGAVHRGRITVLREDPRWEYRVRVRNTHDTVADIWMSATRKLEA